MSQKFNAGDGVYDQQGNFYQYVSEHPSGAGHICLPWFESRDNDGSPYDWTGDPVTIRVVYSDAQEAVQKSEAKVAELNAKADALRLELAELQKTKSASDREISERKARITQHEKLRLLDDYIAGKITHFVVAPEYGSTVEVKTVEQALKDNDRHARGIKLLTLYGDSKGDLQFRINSYSDGSGNSFSGDAYPFTNEGDAQAFAKDLVARKLNDCISGKHGVNGAGIPAGLDGWAKTAKAFGVPIPDSAERMLRDYAVANAEKLVESTRAKLAEAELHLANMKGGA